MPRQMVNPKINEVSGVDHPAHLIEGWLALKDASPETILLLARAEAVAKGLDPNTVTLRGNEMPDPLAKDVVEALPADVQSYIKALEDAAKGDDAVTKTATAPLSEAEQFEKAMDSLPEPVREAVRKSQHEAAEAKAVAKTLFDASEDAKFAAIAKSLDHIPGTDDSFAADLRKVASVDQVAFDNIMKALKAANAGIAEGRLYKELGAAGDAAEGSGQAALEAVAKSLQKEDPKLSYEVALAKAAESHPDLYTQHRREYNAAQRGA